MRYPKRLKKTGKPGGPRGIRLKRTMRFQPALETITGVPVRSKLEQACVEWLENHGFEFQYEPLMLLEGRKFRPDFYLPGHNIFLEICGYTHMPHYRERLKTKKHLYARFNMKSIFIECNTVDRMIKALDREFIDRGLVDSSDKGD